MSLDSRSLEWSLKTLSIGVLADLPYLVCLAMGKKQRENQVFHKIKQGAVGKIEGFLRFPSLNSM